MRRIRAALRPGDALLLGSDLVKPERDLLLAYDDPLHVTAAFNRNLLRRINDELGGTFDLEAFAHRAVWRPRGTPRRDAPGQPAPADGRDRRRRYGGHVRGRRSIWTESSHRYDIAQVREEGRAAGFKASGQWVDEVAGFALTRFSVTA